MVKRPVEANMANSVDCPACHGTGMQGASSCPRCRGTGSIRANAEQDAAEMMGEDLVQRVEPRRVKAPAVKLSTGARKTGKGLSFKR
jgi:uncharacterized phage protein